MENQTKLDNIKELLVILNNNLEKTNEKIDNLEKR